MNERPVRKRLAHGVKWEDDSHPILFVTICVQQRSPLLANDVVHALLTNVWRDADAWLVGRYIVMPDHLHFFAAPRDAIFTLEAWMHYRKSQLSKRWSNDRESPTIRWQSEHWDTRIRTAAIYAEKWDYVRNNPVRRGLAQSSDEWPWQGELNELRWD